jgi:hypothetical protein
MKMLKTKLSRIVYLLGVVIAFYFLHFFGTDPMVWNDFIYFLTEDIVALFIYFAILLGIPLLLSLIITAVINWIKSGK